MSTLEWERIEPTESVNVGDYRTLVRKNFILPSGEHREYVTKELEGSQAQAVIALTPDNKVIIAKQFRPGPQKIMYDLPGGGAAGNETSAEAAFRELEEETGYTTQRFEPLGSAYKEAYTNCIYNYFIAYDCVLTGKPQQLDSTEFIDVVLVTITEFIALAKNSLVGDTEALFFAYDILKERENTHETTN